MMSLATEHVELTAQLVAWGARVFVQSAVLIGLGLAACGLLGRRSAMLRSLVLRGTLLTTLLCPAISGVTGLGRVDLPIPQGRQIVSTPASLVPSPSTACSVVPIGARIPAEPTGFAPVAPDVQRQPARLGMPGLYLLLCTGWIVGTALLLGRLACHCVRARRLLNSARPGPEQAAEICCEMAGKIGIKAPRVMVSPAVRSPVLIGTCRPTVLLPVIHPDAAHEQIFAHELAHLARRDPLWAILSQIVTALHFFQPLLWKLAGRMDQASEEACDDFVLSYVGQGHSYVRRLVDMAEALGYSSAEPAGIGVVSFRSSLGRRVERILSPRVDHAVRMGRGEILWVVALGGLAVFLASLVGVRVAVSAESRRLDAGGILSAETDEPNVLLLIKSLSREDWRGREQAAITLAQMAGAKTIALPALIEALADEQWQVRKAAAVALTTVGPGVGSAVAPLIAALQDEEWQVRRPAAEALAAIGPTAAPADPALANALGDEEWQVRRAAATALAAIGPGARLSTAQLLRVLADEEWHVRESAALALGAIGPEAAAALPALIKRLDDPEWRVRRATAGALERIAVGDKAAIPEVIGALRDSEWQRRQAAAESLERLLQK